MTLRSALFGPLAAIRRSPAVPRPLDLLSLRRQRRRLEELDDRLLNDIGLSRGEAEDEACRRIWDVPRHWRA